MRVKEMIPQRNLNEIANSLSWNWKPVPSVLTLLYSWWFGEPVWVLNVNTRKFSILVCRLERWEQASWRKWREAFERNIENTLNGCDKRLLAITRHCYRSVRWCCVAGHTPWSHNNHCTFWDYGPQQSVDECLLQWGCLTTPGNLVHDLLLQSVQDDHHFLFGY